MGLFKDVGRRVEQFKQAARDAAEEEATHRCTACGERFYTAQETCPECGGEVHAVDAGDESDASTGDDGAE